MRQESRRKPRIDPRNSVRPRRRARSLFACLLGVWTLFVCAVARAQQNQPPPPQPPPASGAESGLPAAEALERPLSLEGGVRLALLHATTVPQAHLNERIGEEDVRQARVAFLPKLAGNLSVIYDSPARGVARVPGTPRLQSFIAANAVTEYLGLAAVTGELDVSSRLRATLQRNLALLEAAHAGTEVARRSLVQATYEAY